MITKCEFCNKEYTTYKNWYNRVEHHTCSRDCAGKLTKKLHIKICNYCNKEFHSKSHQKEKLYCSIKCASELKKKRTILSCQECGTSYIVVNSRVGISKFCSDACRVKYTGYLASLRVGELSPVYKGFNDERRTNKSKLRSWASSIKRRDKFCKLCGSDDNLQSHHIKSYKENKDLRFNLENGILLCGTCHSLQHENDNKPVIQLILKRNGNRQKVDTKSS